MSPIGRGLPSIEERVLAGLSRIGIVLKSQAWRDAGPRGLTPTQAQILAVIEGDPGGGPRIGELAARLAVSAATVSDAVRALVRKGLARKEPAADDARAVVVRLTAAGGRAARETASWPDFLTGTVDALTAEEKRVLLRSLVKMIRALQERGQIPVARVCATCSHFRPNAHADPERPHHCAFVDAAFGDAELRLDCPDHRPADDAGREVTRRSFG